MPEPPPHRGWANFLRNLDELNLDRLPEDIREETFAAFAPDEEMRIYGRGIRRRLAPMLDGNRARIELAFSLLLSSPGVPLILYGDEIGLGEDLSRPGREPVRVPMQWNAGSNAGFSTAQRAKLVQPPVTDGPFSFKRVNVEAQREDPGSLLNRVRAMILARRRHELFNRGTPGHAAHRRPGAVRAGLFRRHRTIRGAAQSFGRQAAGGARTARRNRRQAQ
ncbi:hypothetical protein Q1M63_16950 (plasmid) [Sinorhizobium meliloti]|nr:hypothetical protein Q1M63_16950 [Sinorhizobium meliloti]